MAVYDFLTSVWGRFIRMMIGMFLSFLGLFPIGGLFGWILVMVGLAMVLTGALNYLLSAPLFGKPIRPHDLD